MNPDPLTIDLLITDDQRRLDVALSAAQPIDPMPWPDTRRQRCINRIEAHLGRGGLQAFLNQPQPAFGGKTGAELIQHQPDELLRRLDDLERGIDDQDEDLTFDPVLADRPPQRISSKKAQNVLAILDELKGRQTL